jgi:hypothetical protein
MLRYIIAQFAKVLPHDVAARRAFVTSGGLAKVQQLASKFGFGGVSSSVKAGGIEAATEASFESQYVGSKLTEHIRAINECYPEEIVRYYSPGYSTTLLDKIDEYAGAQAHANPGKWAFVAFAWLGSGAKSLTGRLCVSFWTQSPQIKPSLCNGMAHAKAACIFLHDSDLTNTKFYY